MTVKEQIIKTLLESPKTTSEIAVALNYSKRDYNSVDKELKTLQSNRFIHYTKIKIPGKCGPVPKTYDIVYDIPRLRDMLQKFPNLISDMIKNSNIISLLIDNDNLDTLEKKLLGDLLPLSESFFRNYLTNDSFFERFKIVWFNINYYEKKVSHSKLNLIANAVYPFILFEMFIHCVIEDNINGVYIPGVFGLINAIRDIYMIDRDIDWQDAIK